MQNTPASQRCLRLDGQASKSAVLAVPHRQRLQMSQTRSVARKAPATTVAALRSGGVR
jgi:hypothetical protein